MLLLFIFTARANFSVGFLRSKKSARHATLRSFLYCSKQLTFMQEKNAIKLFQDQKNHRFLGPEKF